MANESLAPSHGDPKTRKIHRHAQFPKWLIQDLVPTSTIDRITLIMDDATGKILRAETRLLGDYAYRNIIIDDPWILGAFNVRTDHAGYVRFPPATKLQLEPFGEDNLDDDAQHPDTARLVEVTKVPASEAYARRHVEDVHDRSVTKSTGQQRLDAWWNSAVDCPESKSKQDAIGARNEDQVDANSSSKRVRRNSHSDEQRSKCMRLGAQSASQSAAQDVAQARGNNAGIESEVINLTGDPNDQAPSSDVLGPGDLDRPEREGSKGLTTLSVGARRDSDNMPASSVHVHAISQATPSARSQARLAAAKPGHQYNAAPLSNLKALRLQRDRLRDRNDSIAALLLQHSDSEPAENKDTPTAKQSEMRIADNHLQQAETELKLAKSRRNDADAYPSELIVVEAKVVKCEIRIEECYHTLYTLKASAEGALVTTPDAPATTAWQGAAVPTSKLDRLRTQRDSLRARSDSLLANILRQTNHGSDRTRETSADKKAAAARVRSGDRS